MQNNTITSWIKDYLKLQEIKLHPRWHYTIQPNSCSGENADGLLAHLPAQEVIKALKSRHELPLKSKP